MTPDRARYLIHVYGALEITDLKAPEYLDALETIATMRTEYAIEQQNLKGGGWSQVTGWLEDENPLNEGYELADDERIVKRYVTAPQLLGEDQ